ncbi:MAG: Ig domain-containing protein, partial [Erysipelotrichaceae bacterium]|nr:Ig domain-containing protein [Erysipelotrichaceae bacterium]
MKPLMNRIAFLSGVGFLLVFGYAGNHTIHAETVEPQTQETTEDVDPLEPMEPTEEPEQTQTKPVSQNEGTDEEIQSDPVLEEEMASVQYQTHVQTYGWQTPKVDGQTAGTSGQSKRLESIRISVKDSQLSGHIQYRTHIQSYGWETSWKQDGQISGTTSQSKRLEAIQIRLTDQLADLYSIYYRVHCQNYGWLGWAKDGEYAGSQGFSKRLEAIEIQLVRKGETAPSQNKTAFV